jgi:hypothetical protein
MGDEMFYSETVDAEQIEHRQLRADSRPVRIKKLLKDHAVNLAAGLTEATSASGRPYLEELGEVLVDAVRADNEARAPRCEHMANIRKLFACVREPMSWPIEGIPKAAVPIINVAVSQWQARERPQLMPSKGMVNVLPGGHEDTKKARRAEKAVNNYLRKLRRYRDGMDKMLGLTALDGMSVRKLSWDTDEQKLVAQTLPAAGVIVSSAPTGDIRDAARVTHLQWMTPDDLEQKELAGEFINTDGLEQPLQAHSEFGYPIDEMMESIQGVNGERTVRADDGHMEESPIASSSQRMVLETHTRIRLPGSEALHPVIVWTDVETKRVLRIVSREYEWDGQLRTFHFFVKYGFLPNADGFYDYGLGTLLESYNAMANVIANVLIVQGLWKSTITGWVSDKAGIPREDLLMQPGLLKPVAFPVDDVNKAVSLIKFDEPSSVLFSMLGSIHSWGKEIASVNDMLQGLEQPANQTATTTITLVEQGLKLFAAVHARMLDAYQEELESIFELLRIFLSNEEYNALIGDDGSDEYKAWAQARQAYELDLAKRDMLRVQGLDPEQVMGPMQPAPPLPFDVELDLAPGYDIQPVADPQVTSEAQRLMSAKEIYATVMQNPMTAQNPHIVREALRRYLDAMGTTDIEDLLPPEPPLPQPPPPPQDLDQVLEDAMFMRGDPSAKVLPEQDHADHLQKMQLFDATGMAEQMDPGARAAREQHRREHDSFLWLAMNGALPNGSTTSMAVPAPAQAPGAAPNAGGLPGLAGPPVHGVPAPAVGPGEALDNASPQLRGQLPGLSDVAS